MKILIVGAGALGGYFGARLLLAGRDVTFLVRPGRARQIAATGGLVIKSPHGDAVLEKPPLITAPELAAQGRRYDLILLGCKANGLAGCMADMAPAVGPDTMILPMLNGMRHIELLSERFGRKAVLGGRCFIFATLDADGRVIHQGDVHTIDFGELDGGVTPRMRALEKELSGAGFLATVNPDMMQGMWEKWVLITCVAGSTSLMRATVGDIVRAGAFGYTQALIAEVSAIARAHGHPPSESFMEFAMKTLSDPDSTQAGSMAKDIEKGIPIEADHILGDLLARIPAGDEDKYPLVRLIYSQCKVYEARREREGWA